MKTPAAIRTRTSLALAAWAAVASPAGAAPVPARPTGNPTMLAFARAMRDLDAALLAHDPQALAAPAGALRAAATDTTRLVPQKNTELLPLFQEYRLRVGKLGAELGSCASQHDLVRATGLVRRIRQNCMTCHETFREEKGPPAAFPRDGNIVSGQVRILSLDGKEVADRSNVVVFIDGMKASTEKCAPERFVLSQKDRNFVPRVLPVPKGSIVEFPNNDVIFHNVFSLSQSRNFDLDIYQPGESREVLFPNSGLVKVYCNIHPHMAANIVVLDNPFFCVTNPRGVFVINGIPDGIYTLRTWSEFGKQTSTHIELAGGALHRSDVEIQETVRSLSHLNKFCQPYRSDY